jgi:ATPase family associated with various cellular activities (AAA)
MSFLKSGNTYRVTSKEDLDLHDRLPVGTYVVKFNNMQGQYYVERVDDFSLPTKLYGSTNRHAERILNTFLSRPASTGVMLTGEKGSGKTLLSKRIAVLAAAQGISTLIVNTAFCGDGFNSFLQNIAEPTVVLFDEFEKTYGKDEQKAVLTLFDGVFPSRKLFVLTCNDKYQVDSYMRNRPGRIYYMLDFQGLEPDFIREYCTDNLLNQQHTNAVCKMATLFKDFNFDMLKAIVEEMNRYQETPQQAVELLNIKPEFGESFQCSVSFTPGPSRPDVKSHTTTWEGQPLREVIGISCQTLATEDQESEWFDAWFSTRDLEQIDPQSGCFTFCNSDGDRLMLTRQEKKKRHWYSF